MAKVNQGEALNWAHPDKSFFSDTIWLCQDVRGPDTYRTIEAIGNRDIFAIVGGITDFIPETITPISFLAIQISAAWIHASLHQ
jgi:hypothetical protein